MYFRKPGIGSYLLNLEFLVCQKLNLDYMNEQIFPQGHKRNNFVYIRQGRSYCFDLSIGPLDLLQDLLQLLAV